MHAVALPVHVRKAKVGRFAWLLLILAWIMFLLPAPGSSLFVGLPLTLMAFVLAIVAIANRGTTAGIGPLLAALIVSPIVYLLGTGSLTGTVNTEEELKRAAQTAIVQNTSAPTIKVRSADLLHAYHVNQANADQTYKDKRLEVTGSIVSISTDFGKPLVLLNAGDFETVYVRGLTSRAASSLHKDQRVTLICAGDSATLGTPALAACIVK